jgi:flavodoxin
LTILIKRSLYTKAIKAQWHQAVTGIAMRTLIICFSYHHKNTEKIASVLAKALDAEVKSPKEVDAATLSGFDLVGFGSGIAFGSHYKELLDLAENLPVASNGKAFVFSTSGQTGKTDKFHKKLKEKLQSKGYIVIGDFNCAGFDTYGALKIFGGINKSHPDQEDLKKAEEFSLNLTKFVDGQKN